MAGLTSGSLLDQILEGKEGQQPDTRPAADASEWGAFLREIVRLTLFPGRPPAGRNGGFPGCRCCRDVAGDPSSPRFPGLEAAWRAVRFLVSRVETDTQLKLYLVDISKAELSADLAAAEDLRSIGMYRLLVEETVETPGGEPWAVLAGNYTSARPAKMRNFWGALRK